jgi:hypothetical protein
MLYLTSNENHPTPPSSVIKSPDASDVMISADGAHFETKILVRRIFQESTCDSAE